MRSLWKILALCALGIYAICTVYSLFFNAEVRFWSQALEKKNQWVQKMDKEPGEKVIFAGGSMTLFAFQSEELFETKGIQSVNMGMTVGTGTPFLLSVAYEAAQPGDTLILLLEPSLLCSGEMEPTSLSVLTALRNGDLGNAFGHPVWDMPEDWGLIIGSMRPGAYHSVTALLKVMFGRPPYRYPAGNVDASGYLFMSGVSPELQVFKKLNQPVLSEVGKEVLHFFRKRCDEKGVPLYYSLPWILCETESIGHNRDIYKRLEQDIAEIVPVLTDEYSGCREDPSLFYDQVHLSPKGASQRTFLLAQKLVDMGIVQEGK